MLTRAYAHQGFCLRKVLIATLLLKMNKVVLDVAHVKILDLLKENLG